MKKILGFLAIAAAVVFVYFVLTHEKALLTHPKGIIAQGELGLMKKNFLLMLTIVVPTIIFLFVTAWKYRAKNSKAEYKPDYSHGVFGELILWIIPAVVIAVMAVIVLKATHELDPYKPLQSCVKPVTIQVVALDWKWLFIYPNEQIATVNFIQIPVQTPIHFELSGDGSPMNSFWVPQLSGQIYSMTGMTTQLHMMADAPGIYSGRAAEINGEGLADMTFVVKSTSPVDFEDWVAEVKQSPLKLTSPVYAELVKRSKKNPVAFYSNVEQDLYHKIIMKYTHP